MKNYKIAKKVEVQEKDWNSKSISKLTNEAINEYLNEKLNIEQMPNIFTIKFYNEEKLPFDNYDFDVFVIYDNKQFFVENEIPNNINEYEGLTARVVIDVIENWGIREYKDYERCFINVPSNIEGWLMYSIIGE